MFVAEILSCNCNASIYVTNPHDDNKFIPKVTLRPLATKHSLTSGPEEDVADYCINSRCIETTS